MPHANVDLASLPQLRRRAREAGTGIVKVRAETARDLIAAFDAMPRILDHLDAGNVEAAKDLVSLHVSGEAIY